MTFPVFKSFTSPIGCLLAASLMLPAVGLAQIDIDFTRSVPSPKHSMLGSNHGFTADRPTDEQVGDLRHHLGLIRGGHALWSGGMRRFIDDWDVDRVHVMMYPASYGDWDESVYGSMRRPYDPYNKCGYECTLETYDFDNYIDYLNTLIDDAISRGWDKDHRIGFDFWNEGIAGNAQWEPYYDGNYWDGREQDFYVTFKVWHRVMRERMPDAVLVGPSYGSSASFDDRLTRFMEMVRDEGLTLDVLSVHCIANPTQWQPLYLNGLKRLREDYISDGPGHPYHDVGIRELHVNESIHDAYYRAPASVISMLVTLELAGADFAGQASWDNAFDHSAGGRLTPETNEPRPLWWTNDYYITALRDRRFIGADLARFAGLVSADPDEGLGMAMFGWPGIEAQATRRVEVRIKGLQTLAPGTRTLRLLHIPYGESRGRDALDAPLLIGEQVTDSDTASFEIDLTTYDGYVLLVR